MSFNHHSFDDAAAIDVAQTVGVGPQDLAIALLEQSSDCIKMLSIDGHLDFINCNGLAAMEIDNSQQVLGKLWWELWPEESREFVKRKFAKAVQGQKVEFKASCPTAKGHKRRWCVNMRPLLAISGPVVSILASSRDITAGAIE